MSKESVNHKKRVLFLAYRFAIVGIFGFMVDMIFLGYVHYVLGWDPYSARAASFILAVTATWWMNRRYTFSSTDLNWLAEWTRFVMANSFGGSLNYFVYSLLVWSYTLPPISALASGSIVGALSNFLVSCRLVFGSHRGNSR